MIVRLPRLLDGPSIESIFDRLKPAPWEDGKQTALGKSRLVKNNLVVPIEHDASKAASQLIVERLAKHEAFRAAALPKTVMPFRFCRYDEGMGYGSHLDLPLMVTSGGAIRSDISMTVFLSTSEDYDGGELVLESDYGEQRIKGLHGECVMYPAGTLHRVEPVTRGRRLVALTWIQSLVRDAGQRRILFDLAQVASGLDADEAQTQRAVLVRKAYYDLMRLWAEQ
jgi:PKHD-type hydroxylase